MKPFKIIILLIISFVTFNLSAQSDIIGKWKTINEETEKAESIVEIYIKNGKAFGKIITVFDKDPDNPNPICDKCTDYRKNKKILGMVIITNMKKDGDKWVNGNILDPQSGKIYDCKLWIENEKLKVRGYIAFFYRTETWLKAN